MASSAAQTLHSLIQYVTRMDIAAAAAFVAVLGLIARSRSRLRTTKLNGPKSRNPIFGLRSTLIRADDPVALIGGWVKEYGPVFRLPTGFGKEAITLADLKAAQHFLARDTGVYHGTKLSKTFIENLFGRGILWAEDEDHRRQRKALTPAFSLAATRGHLSIFYDSAYKVKSGWEALLDNGASTIEVQSWMNFASLDDIGIAGFGHNFGALDGKKPVVVNLFEAFENPSQSGWVSRVIFLLGPVFPILQKLPARHNQMMKGIKSSMAVLADALIQGGKGDVHDKTMDKSVIGLLLNAEMADEGSTMSREEVLAQMNTLLFAGYETTSISLTWALIELSQHPEKQEALRKELSQFRTGDPSWEDVTSKLPYLNAVVQEILRIHPPVGGIGRTASEDDVIPLSNPITKANGELVSEIFVAKGTSVSCPIAYINQAEEFWGEDGKQFKPERWIDDTIGLKAKTIQGYHHLLTFSDGPRLCIGRNFAVANFKATLSVLIRNFKFELPDGVDTKIGKHRGILPRPKIEGQDGPLVPLVVRRIE